MSDLQSRPYKPNPARCCEACAFGRGEHALWCPQASVKTETEMRRLWLEFIANLAVKPRRELSY